jgi:Protein of unknown function (DUF4238)
LALGIIGINSPHSGNGLLSKLSYNQEMVTVKIGRRDHYLPQGYLRGFIDPARESLPQPLWRFDISFKKWSMKSTKQVGYEEGFYDYAGEKDVSKSVEVADGAFLDLENQFPLIRARLLSKGFKNWQKHLGFLLRYMQMIRARSPLFFAQKEEEGKSLLTSVIKEVHPDGKTLTVGDPKPLSAPLIKNRAINHMREEIAKGADWLWDFNWAIRYCESVAAPFVTSEAPFIVEGSTTEIVQAIKHPDTLLVFPLCWQACMFGSLQRFHKGTDKLESEDMKVIRRKYRHFAQVFLLSPTKLDDIQNPIA